jgi:heptosyltransferase-2
MIRRILVLRGGALGDFLVTLPALRLLRMQWPAARIELAGNARAAELGILGGYLDDAHSQHEARWSGLFADSPLPPEFATWLETFDLVVNFWPDPDRSLARRFPVRPGQFYLAGSADPAIAPAARHFCEPLRTLGLQTDDYCSRLPLREPMPPRNSAPGWPGLGAVDVSGAAVAIHPGSGSPAKNWPAERWLELAGQIEDPILLVLGEAEHERWSGSLLAQFRAAARESLEVADNLPLPVLADALARCRLFLGHDSGVSHLAAALGKPCALLFGPTDPAVWAPQGAQVQVIRCGVELDTIAVKDVVDALMPRGGWLD